MEGVQRCVLYYSPTMKKLFLEKGHCQNFKSWGIQKFHAHAPRRRRLIMFLTLNFIFIEHILHQRVNIRSHLTDRSQISLRHDPIDNISCPPSSAVWTVQMEGFAPSSLLDPSPSLQPPSMALSVKYVSVLSVSLVLHALNPHIRWSPVSKIHMCADMEACVERLMLHQMKKNGNVIVKSLMASIVSQEPCVVSLLLNIVTCMEHPFVQMEARVWIT